jgi:putative ABC transport system permease protein
VLADLFDDVLVELGSRRARALLMVVAVALSAGALQASVGLSRLASSQIGADIAASTLDVLTVSVVPAPEDGSGGQAATLGTLPDDTDDGLGGIDLVADGGRRLDVSDDTTPVLSRTGGPGDAVGTSDDAPDVVAVTSGYLRAARVEAPTARTFFLDGDRHVVLLGRAAAATLGVPVTADPTGLEVWVDGRPFDVVGFVGSGGIAALDDAVVVPYTVGVGMVGDDAHATVLVRAEPGAGAQVARVVTKALRPDAPERLQTSQVVSVSELRRGVSTQMSRLAGWTGTVLMVLTILLIANSMVVAVMARTAEIGLRRALGCSRRRVAGVFLAEGVLIGFLGGLAGSAVSAVAVVAAAAVNDWTATLQPGWVAAGPALGVAVGLVASAYPARRAAAVSPAVAVRSD